jgi:hypothetical protein
VALFLGIAFAAQLEARRVGVAEPAMPDHPPPPSPPREADMIATKKRAHMYTSDCCSDGRGGEPAAGGVTE